MAARRWLLLIVLHVLAALVFLRPAGPGFPLDDTWSHMVYARSIARGEGFAYNPGQQEAGMSAPLWTLLCAVPVGIAGRLGERPDTAVRVLGGLLGLLTAWAGYRLASHAGLWPGLLCALLLTFDPLWTFARFSGMELALFGFLLLLFVNAVLEDRTRRAGWLGGLLVLARPEGAVAVVVGLAVLAARGRRPVTALGPIAIVVGPWLAFCLLVTGHPFPNTALIKLEPVTDPGALARTAGALLADTGWGWALPIAVAAGLVSLEGGRRLYGRVPLLIALALVAAVLVTRAMPLQGDPPVVPFYWQRYAIVAWPLLLVLAAAGLSSLVRTAYAGVLCRPYAAVVLVLPLAATLFAGRELWGHGGRLADRFAAQCGNVEDLDVAAGLWIDEHMPRDATVATHDAGAIRFFGRRRTIDIYGNNCHELLARMRHGDGSAMAWLRRQDIDALCVFPVIWAPGHSPERRALVARGVLPPVPAFEDWAAGLGLTRRAATFSIERTAVVDDPTARHLAIFVRP